MKHFKQYFIVLTLAIVLINCSDNSEVIPQNLEAHDFVWRSLNAYYFWQDSITDIQDFRFSSQKDLNKYLATFNTPNDLLNSLMHSNDVGTQQTHLIDDFTNLSTPPLRTAFTNGIEFGLIELKETDTLFGYVSRVLPNSNASTTTIKRGDIFYAVDDVKLTKNNFNDLLFSNNTNFQLNMADFSIDTVISNGLLVDLTKGNYSYPPISISKTLNYSGQNIGYLMYDNDFSNNYIADINQAFSQFVADGATDLILDLRYNIGGSGFAKTMTYLASMITGQFSDEILFKERWNSKAQSYFTASQQDSIITKFPLTLPDGTSINGLNLNRVFIINNRGMQSSSVELLINSLKPHIEVHLIGFNTNGSDKGNLMLFDSSNYNQTVNMNTNHTYALQANVLQFSNKEDVTFTNGFTPLINLCEENILTLGVLGETDEPFLNRVLELITTGSAGIDLLCPNNMIEVFNTVKSRYKRDTGLEVTRVLPDGPIN